MVDRAFCSILHSTLYTLTALRSTLYALRSYDSDDSTLYAYSTNNPYRAPPLTTLLYMAGSTALRSQTLFTQLCTSPRLFLYDYPFYSSSTIASSVNNIDWEGPMPEHVHNSMVITAGEYLLR